MPKKSPKLFLNDLVHSYAKLGHRAEAEQIINKAEGRRRTKYFVNYGIAQSYALLGEKDAAFVELEKAYQAQDSYLPRMKVDPVMDPLPG